MLSHLRAGVTGLLVLIHINAVSWRFARATGIRSLDCRRPIRLPGSRTQAWRAWLCHNAILRIPGSLRTMHAVRARDREAGGMQAQETPQWGGRGPEPESTASLLARLRHGDEQA